MCKLIVKVAGIRMSNAKVSYTYVVRECLQDQLWTNSMSEYVNDGKVYTITASPGRGLYLCEAGFYFPKEALRFLSKAEEFAYLNGGLRVVKV